MARDPRSPNPTDAPLPSGGPTGTQPGGDPRLPGGGAESTPSVAQMRMEIGSTGLRRSGDYVQHDFLPNLNGKKGAETWFEIGENDPLLGGLLYVFEMMIRRVKWIVAPPKNPASETKAKDAAERVGQMLFKELDREWTEIVGDIASKFQYGFAPLEVTYALADDNELVIKSMDLRDQRSITRWAFDPTSGKVRGLWQQDLAKMMTREVFIPRGKFALYRTTTKGDNPEGRSILRRAYKTYMRNEVLKEAEGRASLRAAGFVLATVPGKILRTDADESEKAILAGIRNVVEALAADRQGAVILPGDVHAETKVPLYGIQYVVADGQRSADMSPLIERGDKRMVGSVLAEFMLLGMDGGGSLALGATKTQLFVIALQAFVDMIASVTNREVIAPWWKYRGEDPANRPELQAGKVGPEDLAALGAFITQHVSSGVMKADDPLEDYLRDVANLPKRDPTTQRESPEEKAALQGVVNGITTEAGAKRGAEQGAARGAQDGAAKASRAREAATEGTRGGVGDGGDA